MKQPWYIRLVEFCFPYLRQERRDQEEMANQSVEDLVWTYDHGISNWETQPRGHQIQGYDPWDCENVHLPGDCPLCGAE